MAALDGGADQFIRKPVSLRELHVRIDSALRRTSHARSLDHRNLELESEIEQERSESSQLERSFKRHMLSMRTLLTVSQDLNRAQQLEELVAREPAALRSSRRTGLCSRALHGAHHRSFLGVRQAIRKRKSTGAALTQR